MSQSTIIDNTLDTNALKRSLLIDAHGIGIPSGAAEIFIDRTIQDIVKAIGARRIITQADLDRMILKELKKYHPDFAYVYENRDKII